MKIFCWLLFVGINFWLLFFLTKKFERSFLLKTFALGIPVLFVTAVAIILLMAATKLKPGDSFEFFFISSMFALLVLIMINLANQFFFFMIDSVVSFHQKNNAANIERQPVKFLISNQDALKRISTIIWFLGSALMLYGIWLGKK